MNNRTRKRVKVACQFCRKSHIACDNEKPCTKCVNRKIDCIVDNNRKRKRTKEDDEKKCKKEANITMYTSDSVLNKKVTTDEAKEVIAILDIILLKQLVNQ